MYGENFPTEFAKRIARTVGLYPKIEVQIFGDEELLSQHYSLSEFQQVAVLHGSENAMQTYFGVELTEQQIDALTLIGDFAGMQASGMAVESMIKIIKEDKSHKDYQKIIELLVNTINEKEGDFGNNKTVDKIIDDLLK